MAHEDKNNVVVYWLYNTGCKDPKSDGYIGISKQVDARIKRHTKRGRFPDFQVKILFNGSWDECLAVEKKYRPTPEIGWNVAAGGAAGYGWLPLSSRLKMHNWTSETIAKMVATRKANGSYKISDATRAKISAAGKGRKQSSQTIAKRVATRKERDNYGHTEITRIKMSVSHKGKKVSADAIARTIATRRARGFWHSEIAIAKQTAAKIGRKRDESTKAKISASKLGRKSSDETRLKMSVSQKARRHAEVFGRPNSYA